MIVKIVLCGLLAFAWVEAIRDIRKRYAGRRALEEGTGG